MSVEALGRVMWRLRKLHPKQDKFLSHELRRAIMHECGTDPKTVFNNRDALKRLGWIKPVGANYIVLTGCDLTGDE